MTTFYKAPEPDPDRLAHMQMTTGSDASQLGRAAFIVGCLISQNVVHLDLTRPDTFDEIGLVIRLVAACLRETSHESWDLPFKW